MHSAGGVAIEWIGRAFDASEYSELTYNAEGLLLNQEIWHDPNIDDGTNFNVILDGGATSVLNTMLGLAASTTWLAMAAGSGSNAALHTQSALTSELTSGGVRAILTNTSGTIMTSASVVTLNTFNDTTFTPSYTYYAQAAVMATWNGATDARAGQPFQEFALVNQVSTSVPTVYLDRYVFPAAIVLSGNPSPVILQVTAIIRIS